ncbi:MAG TPA: MMPL family transporter [Gaiellaceae bacterium]|nr:MMPL family transporter [Gaiellaceae bacterium]
MIEQQRRRPPGRPRRDEAGPPEPPPAGRASRLYGAAVVWLAPLLVLLVAGAAYGAYRYLPSLASAPAATSDALLPKHPTALAVERESARLFGAPVATPYAVVQRNPHGLSARVQRTSLVKAFKVDKAQVPPLRGVVAIPVLNTGGIVPSSKEHGTTIVTYLYFPHTTSGGRAFADTERYARYLGPQLDVVGATGAEPARVEQFKLLASRIHWTEGATVLLIVLIVGPALRAVLAPILTVLSAGLAFLISQHVLGWLEANSNLTMPNELQGVAVALMLGVVTDYSVFYFASARDAMREGVSTREAVRRSTMLNTPIVFTAGAVVSFGVACLMLGTLGFFRSFGPGMAITVATGLLVSVLLVPAMLRLCGRLLFWPGLRQGPAPVREWRQKASDIATTKPVAFGLALVVLAALAVAASGLRGGLPLGLQLVQGLPSGNPVAVAARAAGQGFAPGVVAPTELLLRERGIQNEHGSLDRLETALEAQPHVAGVVGAGDQPTGERFGAAFAPRGGAARYAIIFDGDPTESPAIRHLERLQRTLPSLLRRVGLGGATVGWGGETALGAETVQATDSSLWRVLAAAFAVNFVFLLLFLRSVLAPLYLLLASAAALAATVGLTIYFFTDILRDSGLPYYIPVAFSVLLLSLGSDYNIFVVGRVWKEADRLPLPAAVAAAAPRAGRAITVAGLALALSFAMLAIIPIMPFAVMAFAMGVGILLDTFLVRSLLVPALVVVFGRTGRWPRQGPERRSQHVSDPATEPLQRQSQGGGDAYSDARDDRRRTRSRRS